MDEDRMVAERLLAEQLMDLPDIIPFRAVDVITLPRLLPTRSNW